MEHDQELPGIIVDEAFQIHADLGPGLLGSVYVALLEARFKGRGLRVERQKIVVFTYDGMVFNEGLRSDVLVEGRVVVELKSVEQFAPVHFKQVLTYFKVHDLRVGLLINFGAPLLKQGIKRIVNQPSPFWTRIPPCLRACPCEVSRSNG
ncbi:MAG: GxxExxY protein [Flavobacteriales bacterium]|nr:GxxExxY protein [Flavobacteriales bacterium]MCC6938744.1 GxxExxY protein [Flavobacteriales bacterium]